ncbi:protein of unknown function [Azospirillum lipoferum 4B]|uniref:Uncharacterized protein n=1 Tax=Azospirillum lipoferum (strain 4B) TaxID=862719 RepID=G7Z2P6_AZOL4|nr:protein of unknown function [Azospirillum lipoferum 4B]
MAGEGTPLLSQLNYVHEHPTPSPAKRGRDGEGAQCNHSPTFPPSRIAVRLNHPT